MLVVDTNVLCEPIAAHARYTQSRLWLPTAPRPSRSTRWKARLPIDSAVALKCARLHVPDRRAERDALIAATAIVHGMTVVTGNVADFEATGVGLINPWIET